MNTRPSQNLRPRWSLPSPAVACAAAVSAVAACTTVVPPVFPTEPQALARADTPPRSRDRAGDSPALMPRGSGQPSPPAAKPQPKRVLLAPGVLIDWSVPRVEVEAKVVLRQGALELLACSPNTREHESILRVEARPRDIFHAMGLIGLQPGSPLSYDEERKVWVPPTGAGLSLLISYVASAPRGGRASPRGSGVISRGVGVSFQEGHAGADNDSRPLIVEAREWLLDVAAGKPPASLKWIFAGSRTFRARSSSTGEGERFGADADGTVVCVVDFDTALIAAAQLHSADNESLWLAANTERIPPLGTPCKLLIADSPPQPNPQSEIRNPQSR